MDVIDIRGVGKKFSLRSSAKLLREHLANRFWKSDSHHGFYALRDISFRVAQAEGVQIVGANGAGKSTLLSIVTGLAEPDSGTVQVNGRVGALLELGSGFHQDLTGRENLVLNAALIGINEARTREMTPKIIEFSELGDFINEPLRTYSAGMVMRLAFSVAISLEPEILIVDEVLGVGDAAFQRKCFDAIRGLRQRGTALLCVSHGGGAAAELCSRVIWLHEGRLVLDGPYLETMAAYQTFMQSSDRSSLTITGSSNPDKVLSTLGS
jgi:ABC-type polysaccharide/polyol phosphate transport system ATPase subunit